MFGAIAVVIFRLRLNPTQILVVIGINVFLSLSLPGISLWVHLGGLLAGTLATLGVLFLPEWLGVRTSPRWAWRRSRRSPSRRRCCESGDCFT
ncbi:Rhomboid family protein [Mycobacteroides abscessus subsp. abscessus]|nr:Rhomboid family protein [Mycobacteroides abscessus subsp. abscessus]